MLENKYTRADARRWVLMAAAGEGNVVDPVLLLERRHSERMA